MSDRQYQIILELFHEYKEAFCTLPYQTKAAFYKKLYRK